MFTRCGYVFDNSLFREYGTRFLVFDLSPILPHFPPKHSLHVDQFDHGNQVPKVDHNNNSLKDF